jgi:hypothetical protein
MAVVGSGQEKAVSKTSGAGLPHPLRIVRDAFAWGNDVFGGEMGTLRGAGVHGDIAFGVERGVRGDIVICAYHRWSWGENRYRHGKCWDR